MLRTTARQGRWRRWFGTMGGHGSMSLSMDQQRVLDAHRTVARKQIAIIEGPPGTGKSVCAASFLLDAATVSVPTLVFAPSSESHSSSIPMLRHLQERTQLGYVDSLPHMQVQSLAQWCQAFNDEFSTTQRVMNHAETVAFVFQHIDSIEFPSLRSSSKSPPMLQRAVKDLLQLFQHLESHGISSDEFKSIVAGFVREGSTMSPDVFDDFVAKQTDLCGAYAAYRGLLAQHNVTTWHGSVCDTLSHIQQHPFYLHAAVSHFDRILVDDLHAMTPAMLKVLGRVVVASSKQHCVAFTRPSDSSALLHQFIEAAATVSSVQDIVWNHTKLTTNLYTSTSIVQAAAAIAKPSTRDALPPQNPAIETHAFTSPQDEVDFVANLVASADLAETVAIVCADRRDVPLVMGALQKHGLDGVQSLERQNVFDATIVQTAHALLQALANPSVESKYIFSLLHTSPQWRVIPSKLAAIMELQRKRHVPLLDVLVQLADDSTSAGIPIALDAASLSAIQSFVTVFTQLQELSTTSSCLELLHSFFTKTGELESLMQPTSEADAVASQALAAYLNAVGDAQHATKSLHVPFVAPYLQLLKESGRLVPPRDADETVEPSRVTVASIKTAEKRYIAADTIVFMGMTDKAFPGRKPRQPSALPTALVESISKQPSSSAKRLEFLEGCRETLSRLMLCAKSTVVFSASGDTPSRILAPLWQSPVVHPSAVHPPSTDLGRGDSSDSDRPFHLEHVSFSQLDEYMRCSHRYYLARVVKIEPPTAPGLVYGRSLHEGIAAWSAASSSPHAVQNALDALTSSWEPGCFRSKDEEELLLAQATDALLAFIEFETSNPSRIASVETPFDIDVPEANVRLKGVWDRIDLRSDGAYVVEFKSNLSNGPRNNQALAESSLQLQLYMLAYARVHGVPPKGGVLRSLESPHGLNDEGLILYDANADDQVLQGVVDAVKRIRRREFDATPSFMGCAYCPFADVCPSKL